MEDNTISNGQIEGDPPQGFRLIPRYLTQSDQEQLLRDVEETERTSLKLHRGAFPYSGGWICQCPGRFTMSVPQCQFQHYPWIQANIDRLSGNQVLAGSTREVTLVRYSVGMGIHPHCDTDVYDTLLFLCLGESAVLHLTNVGRTKIARVLLRPGDLYVLSGEARNPWEHEIPNGKQLIFLEQTIHLHRIRTSICFRGMSKDLLQQSISNP